MLACADRLNDWKGNEVGKNHSTNRERSRTARVRYRRGQEKQKLNNARRKRVLELWRKFWKAETKVRE